MEKVETPFQTLSLVSGLSLKDKAATLLHVVMPNTRVPSHAKMQGSENPGEIQRVLYATEKHHTGKTHIQCLQPSQW